MGSGKRNYNAMRAKYRFPKKKKEKIEEGDKEINEEDVNELKRLWKKKKEENENNT